MDVPECAEEKVSLWTGAPCTIYLTGNPEDKLDRKMLVEHVNLCLP